MPGLFNGSRWDCGAQRQLHHARRQLLVRRRRLFSGDAVRPTGVGTSVNRTASPGQLAAQGASTLGIPHQRCSGSAAGAGVDNWFPRRRRYRPAAGSPVVAAKIRPRRRARRQVRRGDHRSRCFTTELEDDIGLEELVGDSQGGSRAPTPRIEVAAACRRGPQQSRFGQTPESVTACRSGRRRRRSCGAWVLRYAGLYDRTPTRGAGRQRSHPTPDRWATIWAPRMPRSTWMSRRSSRRRGQLPEPAGAALALLRSRYAGAGRRRR